MDDEKGEKRDKLHPLVEGSKRKEKWELLKGDSLSQEETY